MDITKLDLYHLSPKKDLEGVWTPKTPAGWNHESPEMASGVRSIPGLLEPETPRVCVSTSITGALKAIYSNHRKHILETGIKQVAFQVYVPMVNGDVDYICTKDLSMNRLVWDAHVTEELWLLSPVQMNYLCEVAFNLDGEEVKEIFPFDSHDLGSVEIILPKTRTFEMRYE